MTRKGKRAPAPVSDPNASGFEVSRSILELSSGATFRKVDLHVHTPASPDMHDKWKAASADQVVQHALANGVQVIAVTDHNSAEWCEDVREAAVGTGLAAFSGVEISTSEGHLLAIFDSTKPTQEIKELLIRAGIPAAKFGKPEALAKGRLDDVAKLVVEAGGLAIAAHVDQRKGFWKVCDGARARRQELYASPYLEAVEVVGDEALTLFTTGNLGQQRRLPCVQGSDCWADDGDAHHLDAIGRRYFLLKIDELSIEALRQALLDPSLRVRLATEEMSEPSAVIEGLAVTGGFLDGQRFRLNDNITCLIGGTGSGKSLTLELLRFALDQQTLVDVLPKIADEVDRLLQFALGDAATVRVLLRKNGDRYLVERAWRDGEGSDPVVHRVLEDSIEPVEGPVHLPSFFPIKGFSQGEVIEHAREPLARLSLIDDLIKIDSERAVIKELKSKLRENAKLIVETYRKIENAEAQVKELPGVVEQIKALGKFFEDPRVKGHDGWYKEQTAFEHATELIDEALQAIDQEFPWPDSDWEVPESSPNKETMDKLQAVAEEIERIAEKQQAAYQDATGKLRKRVEELQAGWRPKFDAAEKDYQRLLTELDKDGTGLPSLHKKLTRLRDKESKLARTQKQVEEKLRPQLGVLESAREKDLKSLQNERRKIRDKRRAKAKELTDRLESRVRITVRSEANEKVFYEALSEIRRGSRIQDSEIKVIAEKLHPVPLVKSLMAQDFDTPAKESELASQLFQRLHDAIHDNDRLEQLYELQLVDLEDVLRIQFAVEGDEYRDLEALAHGQKCTVVLMVALAEGDAPLIVDQPEDALHAPWIEEYIVARLRGDRGTRQCLFATRSGNVLVSADAEQVIGMEADAHAGRVSKTGALDRFETRELVLYHVEGGRDAFERRRQKYGL